MDFMIMGLRIRLGKRIFIGIVISAGLIMILSGYILSHKDSGIIIGKTAGIASDQTNAPGEASEISGTGDGAEATGISQKSEPVRVYVVGCVKKPGIVELHKGSMISDAIKKAGGARYDADIYNINMVFKIEENMMIRINKKESTNVQSIDTGAQKGESKGEDSSAAGKGIIIEKGSGNASVTGQGGSNAAKNGLININTADSSELDRLPGIGEKTAADIIAYRKKSGGFKRIEDLMNVPRIGQKRLDSMKDLITL